MRSLIISSFFFGSIARVWKVPGCSKTISPFTAIALFQKESTKGRGRNCLKEPHMKNRLARCEKNPETSEEAAPHKGSSANTVYGLTICCGDILEKDCKSCIVNAANEIRSNCPNNKGATIWYYYCTLKYHNLDFFGQIDRDTLFFANTPKNMNTNN
ncbi:cysteine-rich repeat secretory protein 38 [Quercus suber]|uniref:Cysteine-rich repeat secretory protein 38 n=1 Tax=Quercus suber TaxID=58331 RepID=A0AAW0MAM8_QUESU